MTNENTTLPSPQTKDAVCVGFGPAGIALACVLEDARETGDPISKIDIQYLEKASCSQWHPELLLKGTDINHHMLRDLVTPRNPRSRFSFAMYLKQHDRMFDFGLLGRPASRHEWSDYVTWVSRQVDDSTCYDAPATEIQPITRGDRLDQVRVITPKGEFVTRNLILASGSTAHIPCEYKEFLGKKVFHTSQFLTRLQAFGDQLPKRWMVIGSGQSASESIIELLDRRRDVLIHSIHRSAGFRLTQLGQFPNQVFSPAHVDYFHSMTPEFRRKFLETSRTTNYAGIDPDESLKLYSMIYEDRMAGRTRLQMHPHRRFKRIVPGKSGYQVTLADTFNQQEESFEVDAIVLATGYEQPLLPPLLTLLQPWLQQESDGGVIVNRDYELAVKDHSDVRIFVNGLSERCHGISDGQSFSLLALRAERVVQGLARTYRR